MVLLTTGPISYCSVQERMFLKEDKMAYKLICRLGGNMVSEIDKRNRLREEPFSYQITKKGTVIIYFEGKQIKTVKDRKAAQLIGKLNAAESIMEVQLLLAKLTGNFKHGNEKTGKIK